MRLDQLCKENKFPFKFTYPMYDSPIYTALMRIGDLLYCELKGERTVINLNPTAEINDYELVVDTGEQGEK